MIPEQYSKLNLYGDKSTFQKKLMEGYTEVAFGSGPWIANELTETRIVAMWAFYKRSSMFKSFQRNENVSTLEHPKMNWGGMSVRGNPYEAEYSTEQFQAHVSSMQISLSGKMDLIQIVKNWE